MQLQLLETPGEDLLAFEKRAYDRGFLRVAGIDEVGRGPLAGPVVAAAVILPPHAHLEGVRDSKQLSKTAREQCCQLIRRRALAVGIGRVDALEIDRINILQATFLAMTQAVQQLSVEPDYLLIDGPYTLPLTYPQLGVRQGDRLSVSIAAASIIAKVHRDQLMARYHEQYPDYGFVTNKGYPTRAHREALRRYGPSPVHRRSFRGVMDARQEGPRQRCMVVPNGDRKTS